MRMSDRHEFCLGYSGVLSKVEAKLLPHSLTIRLSPSAPIGLDTVCITRLTPLSGWVETRLFTHSIKENDRKIGTCVGILLLSIFRVVFPFMPRDMYIRGRVSKWATNGYKT
jgi:hypothetical protein